MRRWIGAGMVLGLGLAATAAPARAQVSERDTTITGPRGRSIERSVRTERGPGFVERDVQIHRPGGTFQRDVRIARPGGFAAPGSGFRGGGFVPGGFGPRIIERNVFVNPGLPLLGALGIGAGSFGLGMLTGSALSAPPPIYGYPAPPPVVVVNQPQPYSGAAPPPATIVVDPVASTLPRLQSLHSHSRRDGCYTLGRLRDPRAVPALVDRLKNDYEKEVRIAAATALGEIGDPRAIAVLEGATVYDKRQEVRAAATAALSRLAQVNSTVAGQPAFSGQPSVAGQPAGVLQPSVVSQPSTSLQPIPNGPTERVPPPPTPALGVP